MKKILALLLFAGCLHSLSAQTTRKKLAIWLEKAAGANYTILTDAQGKQYYVLRDDLFSAGSGISISGGVISATGLGGVSSWNTRTGAVTPLANDYSALQISNTPNASIAATNAQAAINELESEKLSNAAGAVGNSNLRNSAATSVIGRSDGTAGPPADIAAGSDGQLLRRASGVLGFGSISLANSASVTGTLGVGNGGTGLSSLTGASNKTIGVNSGETAYEFKSLTGGTGISVANGVGSYTFNLNVGAGGIYGGSGSLPGNVTVTQAANTLTFDQSGASSSPTTLILKGKTTGFSTKHLQFLDGSGGEVGYVQTPSGAAELRLWTATSKKLSLNGTAGIDLRVDANTNWALNTNGTVTFANSLTSDPTSPSEASQWYNSTDDRMKIRAGAATQNIATVERDVIGQPYAVYGTNFSIGGTNGDEFFQAADANTATVTITVNSDMKEGYTYRLKCRRNATNIIQLNGSSAGYFLEHDGSSTVTPPQTLNLGGAGGSGFTAPYKIYFLTRSGTTVFIK